MKIFDDEGIDWGALDNAEVVSKIKEKGYDSIYVSEPDSISGRSIFVTNPNQIKSSDPVTYDDNGDIIPISKRFNPKLNDIRYALAPLAMTGLMGRGKNRNQEQPQLMRANR